VNIMQGCKGLALETPQLIPQKSEVQKTNFIIMSSEKKVFEGRKTISELRATATATTAIAAIAIAIAAAAATATTTATVITTATATATT